MSKKDDRPPVTPPALFPIDEALLNIFSTNPVDQEPPTSPSFFADDDWLLAEAQSQRDAGTASAASGDQGADRATGTERSEPRPQQRADQRSERAEPPPVQPFAAPARDSELERLPKWQRRFVLGLRTFGVVALAAREANVSRASIERYRRESPEFDAACASALKDALDAVEAATIQSATVGDVQPVYQGGNLVGHKRMKNPKAAELIFKKAGYLEDKPAQIDDRLKVEAVTDAELAQRFGETMQRLFAARQRQPLIDAETGKPVRE